MKQKLLKIASNPRTYAILLPWIALLLSLTAVLRFDSSVIDASQVDGGPSAFAMPAAILGASLYAALGQSRRRLLPYVLVGAALSFLSFILPNELPLIPRLLGERVPDEVRGIIRHTWLFLTFAAALGLIVKTHSRINKIWWAILTGLIGGSVIVIILAYPLYVGAYNFAAPAVEYAGSGTVSHVSIVAAALIMASLGPVAVMGSGQRRRLDKFITGAATGILAALVFAAALSGPASGLIASTPLYGVAETRIGFSEAEWLLKLALVTYNTFSISLIALWMVIGAGMVIGGLSGLAMPLGKKSQDSKKEDEPLWPIGALFSPAPLVINILISGIVLSALGPALQAIFDRYGYVPVWNSALIVLIVTGQPTLIMLLYQTFGLWWLDRFGQKYASSQLAIAAIMEGAASLFGGILCATLIDNVLIKVGGLIASALSLEMIVAGWKLRAYAIDRDPSLGDWASAGANSGLITLTAGQHFITSALSLLMIPVVLIIELARPDMPPPGIDWLRDSLSGLFIVHAKGFYTLAAFALLSSALMGLLTATKYAPWAKKHLTRFQWAFVWIMRKISPPRAGELRRWGVWIGAALLLDVISTIFPLLTTLVLCAMVSRRKFVERLSLPALWGVFGVALAGFLQLWLPYLPPALIPACWLIFVPSWVLGIRILNEYTHEKLRVRVRVGVLIGVAALSGALLYAGQPHSTAEGGVTSYDGVYWQPFTPENSLVGDEMRYNVYADSAGYVWVGGSTGVVIQRAPGGDWKLITLVPSQNEAPSLSDGVHFAEDGRGRMWVAFETFVGQVWESEGRYILQRPGSSEARGYMSECRADITRARDVAEGLIDEGGDVEGYGCLMLDGYAADMVADAAGNIWVAMRGGGVVRLDGMRPLSDSHWQTFTTANSGLPSDDVRAVHAGQDDVIWFATNAGVARFDGQEWRTFQVPGKAQNLHALYAGTDGTLWVGAAPGFFAFEGEDWRVIDPALNVTAFAEGMDRLWMGTQNGMIGYGLGDMAPLPFDADNSGLAVDYIRDMVVDSGGRLWVSTFVTETVVYPPWIGVGLSLLLFGYMAVQTTWGYGHSVNVRARIIAERIRQNPDALYEEAYALFAQPGGIRILERVSTQVAGDQITALLAVARSDDPEGWTTALMEAASSLGPDSERAWARELGEMYGLIGMMLSAQGIAGIAALELMVNPARTAGRIALSARGASVDEVPPFLPDGEVPAWEAFEGVGRALQKYQEVDDTGDRLGYLAQALSMAENARNAASTAGLPEGPPMVAVAEKWRALITAEIDVISGSAELRLELRTRQVLRADVVTLGLRLQNRGRAAAEAITIELESSDGLKPAGERVIRLDRLAAGQFAPVEFNVRPEDVETVRVACRLNWRDRAAAHEEARFADVVRFYEVHDAFRRIPNPYIVGHPIKSDEMFFGREGVFDFISENISGSVQDRTIVLYGQRRTGKTSILYQMLGGRLGGRFIPILIDMQEMALLINGMGDFFGEIAYQIARTCSKAGLAITEPEMEAFAAAPTRIFNRFLDALEDALDGRQLLLIFDEFELIEGKITDNKLDPEVLGYFRSLIQHRDGLVFIFAGTHRLEEMSHDYWSILFNIAVYRRVSFLERAEAVDLIRLPVKGALDVDDLAVEKVIAVTNGHPYFIQLICWALVNRCNGAERNYATLNDVNDAIDEILTTGEAHFAYIWQQATDDERLALAGLAHTLKPGKLWARPAEVAEMLEANGEPVEQSTLIDVLDGLAAQETLESAADGALRYRFRIDVLKLWVMMNKSIAALGERRR